MPVERHCVGGGLRLRQPQFISLGRTRAYKKIGKRGQTSEQVDAMRGCQKIRERTMRITGNVNSLSHELPPGEQLRYQESDAQDERHQQPTFMAVADRVFPFSPGGFQRGTAD